MLIKPFWVFGIDRTVQNVVGSQEFGFYYSIFNFSFLFNILLDLGVTSFNNRNIAQNTQLLAKHFSGIVSLKLILGFVYFLVTIGAGLLWGFSASQIKLLALVGFNQFLLSFLMYLRSNISGMLMFRTESFMSVLDKALMIIIMSVLLWGGITDKVFRIEWFVYGQTAAYLLAVSAALSVVVFKSKVLKMNWNYPFFLMILRKSFPFALLALLMTFYSRIDTVMINKLLPGSLGDIQVGIYAHAYRILDASNQMSFLFAVLLLPLFSHLIKQSQKLSHIVKISFSLLFVATSILAIGSLFYSQEIMTLLYDEYLVESAQVYSIIVFGVIAMSSSYVFGTLLTANGNMKALNIIAAISVTLSLLLNIILVPSMQARGSAVANLIALSFSTIAQIYIVQKRFRFSLDMRYLTGLVAFLMISFFMAYASRYLPLSNWIMRFFSFVLASLSVAVLFKLLNIREFVSFVKDREM